MTLTDLIKSAEEKLANPDLTLGTRRREEAILHYLTSLERTVTELVSENTELYVYMCEMGDMARERSRMQFRANGKNHDQYEMKAADGMTRKDAIDFAVGCVMASVLVSKTKFQVVEALRRIERELDEKPEATNRK